MKILNKLIALILFVSIISCENEVENKLEVSLQEIEIPEKGDTVTFTIETDAANWEIENPGSDWIHLSATWGNKSGVTVTLVVETTTEEGRKDTLKVTAGNAEPCFIHVSQLKTIDPIYTFEVSDTLFTFDHASGYLTLAFSTDAPEWQLTSEADWLFFENSSGMAGASSINIGVSANPGINERTAIVILSADNIQAVQIYITQKGFTYPDYNTNPLDPDISGMEKTATEIAQQIKIGWNIGNTLETMGSETAWGNPKVSKELIQLVKASGFNAVRIPCAWDQYAHQLSAKIKQTWLDRVYEVVQYCVDNDMYALLNIHWDGGWLENNCTIDKQGVNNAKQKAYWQQIATHLRDFDEHLIFCSANEPNVENATQMRVLSSYHQTFVDAVRSTGGKNAYRVLVVQGPKTDIETTKSLMKQLPVDNIPNRMMAEIHYYTPWNFCGLESDADWGKMFYYWGEGNHSTTDTERNSTWGEEADVLKLFGLMKNQFVDKGIPVVMGEYSAIRRSKLTGDALELHLKSRAYYHKYVTQQAIDHGLIPFYWDNGGVNNHASGIFDRRALTVNDQETLDAIMEGAK